MKWVYRAVVLQACAEAFRALAFLSALSQCHPFTLKGVRLSLSLETESGTGERNLEEL